MLNNFFRIHPNGVNHNPAYKTDNSHFFQQKNGHPLTQFEKLQSGLCYAKTRFVVFQSSSQGRILPGITKITEVNCTITKVKLYSGIKWKESQNLDPAHHSNFSTARLYLLILAFASEGFLPKMELCFERTT